MTRRFDDLRAARGAYRKLRYPGDLPGEMLETEISFRGRMFIGTIAGGAIAAVLVLGAMLSRPMPGGSHARPFLPLVQDIELPRTMRFEMPAIPKLAPHMSLREMAPSLVPAEGVHLPSLDDLKRSFMPSSSGRA